MAKQCNLTRSHRWRYHNDMAQRLGWMEGGWLSKRRRRRRQQRKKNKKNKIKHIAKKHVPSFLRMFLFTSRGELILVWGLGRGELFEVLATTAVMFVT